MIELIYKDVWAAKQSCCNEEAGKILQNLEDSEYLIASLRYAVGKAVHEKNGEWRKTALKLIQQRDQNISENLISLVDWQTETTILTNRLFHEENDFTHIITNLMYLFQECYADITMIGLLDLRQEEYLNLAQHEMKVFDS